jgi:hypothetical protein
MKKGSKRGHFYARWGSEALVLSADEGDCVLDGNAAAEIGELTLNQIRNGISQHRFTTNQLEYLVNLLVTRISVYLDNKFYCY